MGKYAQDPLYADIIPLPTDEGGAHPLAAIAYTEQYEETSSYLRAVMAANEKSPRVLDLTADLIAMNPAHYTVWLYRAATLLALSKDASKNESESENGSGSNDHLRHELSWLNRTALSNLKNYQIWHHRTTLVDALDSSEGERAFMDRMFALDAKNYHVWSYRQWLVRRFDWFADPDELAFTTRMLRADVRNNSVWNHRWFVVNGSSSSSSSSFPSSSSSPSSQRGVEVGVKNDASIRQREIAFAQDAIRAAPQNESAWNYLRAIYRATQTSLADLDAFVREFVGDDGAPVRSSHALEVWSEILACDEKTRGRAGEVLDRLGAEYDPLRANYWAYRKSLLRPAGLVS